MKEDSDGETPELVSSSEDEGFDKDIWATGNVREESDDEDADDDDFADWVRIPRKVSKKLDPEPIDEKEKNATTDS